ncbi:class D sortase [Sporosarcina obsidiansis]|uniref:class D sortase n=1 Tax=Sporosarcina obsidiansis TaxID=2660748 RepID=UPI00129AF671|nr:class D sortase [Sporosarcina obsidiansis]
MGKQRTVHKGSFAKWIGNGLIVAGAVILLLLAAGLKTNSTQQTERLEAFSTMKAEASIATHSEIYSEMKNSSPNTKTKSRMERIEGILEIPQIDLEAPVLLGADETTLAEGLGAIENMDDPGRMDGSYAIAGHQSYLFGQYFNRLHEMVVGQEFTFDTLEGIQQYRVFDIQVVKPEQVEILDRQKGIALMSLITCYPERSNKYRLVVQAKRIK